jgi:hypothetical protein
MIERAEPLLQFTAAKKGGLLRKSAPASVEVILPPENFAPEWGRDGVVEKPEGKIGRRQWWLQQLFAVIPPSHWSTRWNLAPAECIAAISGEFADTVFAAWHQAAVRHPNPAWIAALLLTAAKEGRGPMTFALLNHLPQDARHGLTPELLESPRLAIEGVSQLLRGVEFPLDRPSTAALFRKIEGYLQHTAAGTAYIVTPILQTAALRVPPNLYDDLAAQCTGPKWETVRKALDEFFLNLLIRRDLQREFNP